MFMFFWPSRAVVSAMLRDEYLTSAVRTNNNAGPTNRGWSACDPRWQPVTQSARSRRSYAKIEDCEQSKLAQTLCCLHVYLKVK